MISYRFPSLCHNSWNPHTHLHPSFLIGSPFGWGIPVYWVWRKVHKSTLPCRVSPDGWKLIYLVFHWESCQKSNSYFFLDRLNQTIYLRKNVRQSTVYFHVSLYTEFDIATYEESFIFLKNVFVSRAFLVLFTLPLCNQDSVGADVALEKFAIIISTFQFL